jgi:colicin import membrane protein
MKNEVIEHNKYEAPITFDYNREFVEKQLAESRDLVLDDWQDEAQYKVIKKKRTQINGYNKEIYARKRELKVEAETWLKKVENRAGELKLPLDEAEAHLTKQLRIRENELARIKQEEEEREQREADRRMQLALSIGWDKPVYLIKALSLEDFEAQYQEAKAIFEENKRIEQENKRKADEFQKAQQERMDELDRENRALKAAQTESLRSEVADARKAKEELARIESEKKEEAARLARAEAEAKKKAKDEKMFEEVKAAFPDLPSAWAEIVRLKKEVASNAF